MKQLYLLFFITLISSCKTRQDLNSNKCNYSKYSKNEFKNITYDKYQAIINKDTISITQIKYNCVFTEFLLKKVMFDNFGKWDESRFKENERHPILVWKNIQLFSNQSTNYWIAATGGGEEEHMMYSSVMVFDENGKDLLLENANLRKDITGYFTQLIQNNNLNQKEFYSIYWKEVDPDFYKKYIRTN